MSGVLRGASVVFFAYIGFDAVSTAAQEAKNPQRDMPVGILGSLIICTIFYMAVAAVLTGLVPYQQLNVPDPIAVGIGVIGVPWLAILVKVGALTGLTSVILVFLPLRPEPDLFHHGERWFAAAGFPDRPPEVSNALPRSVDSRPRRRHRRGSGPDRDPRRTCQYRHTVRVRIVCAAILYLRRTQPGLKRPFRCPLVPLVPIGGILYCLFLMIGLPLDTWARLIIWLVIGLVIYFAYGRSHSTLTAPRAMPT